MLIENNIDCFVMLWQKLEHTRQLLAGQHRRFCVRRILKSWLAFEATDDFIWEVCLRASRNGCEVFGMDELPPPSTHPRVHREILRALVQVSLKQGRQGVNLPALDEAYHIAFPNSTRLNVSKKRSAR